MQALPGTSGRWRRGAPVATSHRLFFQPPPSTATFLYYVRLLRTLPTSAKDGCSGSVYAQ
jgi:hypothetical protein